MLSLRSRTPNSETPSSNWCRSLSLRTGSSHLYSLASLDLYWHRSPANHVPPARAQGFPLHRGPRDTKSGLVEARLTAGYSLQICEYIFNAVIGCVVVPKPMGEHGTRLQVMVIKFEALESIRSTLWLLCAMIHVCDRWLAPTINICALLPAYLNLLYQPTVPKFSPVRQRSVLAIKSTPPFTEVTCPMIDEHAAACVFSGVLQ